MRSDSQDHMKRNAVTKLSKLIGADNFITRRQRVEICLKQLDIELVGLSNRPSAASVTKNRGLLEFNMKAKNAIELILTNGTIFQVSTITDEDDQAAKDF